MPAYNCALRPRAQRGEARLRSVTLSVCDFAEGKPPDPDCKMVLKTCPIAGTSTGMEIDRLGR
jgi:hypothetical protein